MTVSPLAGCVRNAKRILLTGLNTPKLFDVSNELSNRIHKSNLGKVLTKGNKISLIYYGKLLLYEVYDIEKDDTSSVEDELENLSLENKTQTCFCEVTERTSWRLFK